MFVANDWIDYELIIQGMVKNWSDGEDKHSL
jgi:hypothetical protein